jgi:Ca2+-transporting ATPase
MLAGGLWSMLVNTGLFWWALSSGRSLPEATTLTFATLTVLEFFKAYNFRSDRHSLFERPFANRWLNRAILWELILLITLINLPFTQMLFGVVPLSGQDWLLVTGVAASLIPVLEWSKYQIRRRAERLNTA